MVAYSNILEVKQMHVLYTKDKYPIVVKKSSYNDHLVNSIYKGDSTKLFEGLYDKDLHIISNKLFVHPIFKDGKIYEMNMGEMYLAGKYTLQEGENFVDGKIVKVEKKNKYYVWNNEFKKYELTPENILIWKDDLIEDLKIPRNKLQNTPIDFEDKKGAIKGRSQDFADITGIFVATSAGVPGDWTFSNRDRETGIDNKRARQIMTAIGLYRSYTFQLEKEVTKMIEDYTEEELLNYNRDVVWETNKNKHLEVK